MFGKKQLIIIKLTGRLGNQLFLFSVGYALAKKLGADLAFHSCGIKAEDLLLPKLVSHHYREATNQELRSVGILNIYEVELFSDRKEKDYLSKKIFDKIGNIIFSRLVSIARSFQKCKSANFNEKENFKFKKDPALLQVDLPVYISGYFQSEEYFLDYSQEIVAAINWSPQIAKLAISFQRPIVAISFRRGDYNIYNGTLPIQYYEKSLIHLKSMVTPGTLLLFGDDDDFVELMEDRWSVHNKVVNAKKLLVKSESPIIDQLLLMTECDHFIIANSTFSWLGAWLCEQKHPNKERVVIAPENWIGGSSINSLPERWIKILSERASV